MTMVLPKEVARELSQVAHRGKAEEVKRLMKEATEAFTDDRYSDALGPLVAAKKDAPRSPSVRELLGLTYYRLGRFRETAREIAAYRRLSAERDQDHVYADAERALGRPEKALDILEGLAREEAGTEEQWAEALIVKAAALGDLGRHDEAVEALHHGPLEPSEVDEHHLRLWYVLADLLDEAGRRSEARDWWDAIYNEDPDFFDVADRRLGLGRRRT